MAWLLVIVSKEPIVSGLPFVPQQFQKTWKFDKPILVTWWQENIIGFNLRQVEVFIMLHSIIFDLYIYRIYIMQTYSI